MQNVSALYLQIISGDHWFETKLVIDGVGTFTEDQLFSLTTNHSMFRQNPEIGGAIAGEIDVKMLYPTADIPTMACLRPYVRAVGRQEIEDPEDDEETYETLYSEWIPQGVYYIDTRERTKDESGLSFLSFHGYDAMLKAEQKYNGRITGSSTDTQMVNEIAYQIGVSVDSRTYTIMNKSYTIPLPTNYSYREVLGYIAAMYAGTFLITDEGKLRLVAINEIPAETNFLIDNGGNAITFGQAPNDVVVILV